MAAYTSDRSIPDPGAGKERLVDTVIPNRWQQALARIEMQANAYGVTIQLRECLLDVARRYFQHYLFANSQEAILCETTSDSAIAKSWTKPFAI